MVPFLPNHLTGRTCRALATELNPFMDEQSLATLIP